MQIAECKWIHWRPAFPPECFRECRMQFPNAECSPPGVAACLPKCRMRHQPCGVLSSRMPNAMDAIPECRMLLGMRCDNFARMRNAFERSSTDSGLFFSECRMGWLVGWPGLCLSMRAHVCCPSAHESVVWIEWACAEARLDAFIRLEPHIFVVAKPGRFCWLGFELRICEW